MKLTYKKHRETGRYASFAGEYHDIKQKRQIVGSISEIRHIGTGGDDDGKFMVRLTVDGSPKDNPNCAWHWITFKRRFESADEAKKFLESNLEEFLAKNNLKLYPLEP